MTAVLAVAGGIAVTLAPDWERQLHAQNYEVISSIGEEARKDAEAERRDVANRLEQMRREPRTRRWGAFLSLERNTIQRRRTSRGNGFESETPGFLLGLDRRFSDTLLLGVAGGFKVTDLEFDDVSRSASVGNPQELGRQRTYSGTIGPYLSYTPDQAWYLDGSLLVGVLDTSTERMGDGLRGTARGDTSGHRLSLAGGGGYDWRYRAFRIGPHVNLAWDYFRIKGFRESGGPADANLLLRVPSADDDLLTVKAGGRTSQAFRFSWGALVPNGRLDFVYRDLDDSTRGQVFLVSGGQPRTFLQDRPDRTSIEVGLGLQLALPNALSFWVDYEQNFLERFYVRERITLGVRKQF
jgi:outer membrane autotransporter protein